MESVQYISDEYLERSLRLSVTERLEFLEEYRLLIPLELFEERKAKYIEDFVAMKKIQEQRSDAKE